MGLTESRGIRVLSPRMDPPDFGDDGSTAMTARDCFRLFVRCAPSVSIRVLFPVPGAPVRPSLMAELSGFSLCSRSKSLSEASLSASKLDSTKTGKMDRCSKKY